VGDFSHTLKIPPQTNSQLLLGEATLYGKEQQVLASQSFMISAGLDHLLEVVKTLPEEPTAPFAPTSPIVPLTKPQHRPVQPLDPKSALATKAHKAVPKAISQAINQAKSLGTKPKPLDLPDFSGRSQPRVNSQGDFHTEGQPNLDVDLTQQPIAPIPSTSTPLTTFTEVPGQSPPIYPPISLTGEATKPETPEDLEAAQAGFTDRNFLSRLNTLAGDRQITEILYNELLLEQSAPGALQKQYLPLNNEPDWAKLEVVVDDEPTPTPEPKYDASGFPYPQQQPLPEVLKGTTIPQPVPVPEILAPEGELLLGESVIVTVKLPPQQFSLYVKFWVKDCETMAIIDGPRILLDFSPNSHGELETRTRLTIPLGCCRVRLEAIAIDPHQEAESRKVSIDRVVVSPDSPSLSTADFNYLAS
jgi:hypothetical protein